MIRLPIRLASVLIVGLMLLFGYAAAAEASWQYTVKAGDTLYLLGQRFGVSADDLRSANGIWNDYLDIGRVLNIPTAGSSTPVSTNLKPYTVRKGDSLFLIAKGFGISLDELRRCNNLWQDTIVPGQVLKLPAESLRDNTVSSRGAANRDLDLLARAVFSEARGENYEGQVAVAAVVLNRVKHTGFPKSIAGVIYEPGAFTAVADGQFNLTPSETAYKAAQDALKGWDPTNGALYYWNPATATNKWVWSRTITKKIGNHVFAK